MPWEKLLEELNNAKEESVGEIIESFLASRVPESTVLDYKSHVDLTSNEHKKKLPKWVAGLANSSGGVLLLGVKEMENTGKPDPDEAMHPVTIPEGTELIQHMTNIINGAVSPVPVFYPFPIDNGNGAATIIIIPASNNKPHVVGKGNDHFVPIRRGTSTKTATREDLDMLYRERRLLEESLEEEATEQFEKYCPEEIIDKPICFIYAVPVGTSPNLINIDTLRNSEEYKNKTKGVPGWGGGHTLPNSHEWRGSSEAGEYIYPQRVDRRDIQYQAIAYRNGAIATWTIIELNRPESSDKVINPAAYFAALHGTLAPWLSFLSELGLTSIIEGRAFIKNVKEYYPIFPPQYNSFDDSRHAFKIDELLLPLASHVPITQEEIIELCFSLFAEMFYTCGYTTDFSKRDETNFYSSHLERNLLGTR